LNRRSSERADSHQKQLREPDPTAGARQTSKDITYQERLSNQTGRDPAKILGPARYKLWRSGRVSLADRIDGNRESPTIDDLRALQARVEIDTLFPVGNPDPFPNPPATVIIPVPAVRPVTVVPVPAMNLAPMFVLIAISIPSDRNF
jgi:hypothetical protein